MKKISKHWDSILRQRTAESRPLIQILLGPRQVGKTLSLQQLAATWSQDQVVFDSADARQLLGTMWIEQQWQKARILKRVHDKEVLLILDEIQKIQDWSEMVKRLWDEDVALQQQLKVVLSGSSSLTIQTGLRESLAGRFEVIPATHGSFPDFRELTGKAVDEYIFFGGYPGALRFIEDEDRWRSYVVESIVEAILSRDIILLTRIDKPALLRRLFQLGCEFSGQVLSYQKALGHLQDAGNTTTLAHYLSLLDQAFVMSGLQKYEKRPFKLRASSPKYQVHNTALMGALGTYRFKDARSRPEIWGRYLESCVGAHLITRSRIDNYELFYWRDRGFEVDFVVKSGRKLLAIEVKSNIRGKLSGLAEFKRLAKDSKTIVVGYGEKDLEEFLSKSPIEWL